MSLLTIKCKKCSGELIFESDGRVSCKNCSKHVCQYCGDEVVLGHDGFFVCNGCHTRLCKECHGKMIDNTDDRVSRDTCGACGLEYDDYVETSIGNQRLTTISESKSPFDRRQSLRWRDMSTISMSEAKRRALLNMRRRTYPGRDEKVIYNNYITQVVKNLELNDNILRMALDIVRRGMSAIDEGKLAKWTYHILGYFAIVYASKHYNVFPNIREVERLWKMIAFKRGMKKRNKATLLIKAALGLDTISSSAITFLPPVMSELRKQNKKIEGIETHRYLVLVEKIAGEIISMYENTCTGHSPRTLAGGAISVADKILFDEYGFGNVFGYGDISKATCLNRRTISGISKKILDMIHYPDFNSMTHTTGSPFFSDAEEKLLKRKGISIFNISEFMEDDEKMESLMNILLKAGRNITLTEMRTIIISANNLCNQYESITKPFFRKTNRLLGICNE